MERIQNITQDILYAGVQDRRLARFENLFSLTDGVSYNSYVIQDEQSAVLDTCDGAVGAQWEENVRAALAGRTPAYLIVQHMEPDHCALIARALALWPQITVVASAKAVPMMQQFFDGDAPQNIKTVAEGETLCLGKHTLQFFMAPMVHWPEVMVTYDSTDKVLFSADAFGTFGAVDGSVFADEHDFAAEYLTEARRYYANICGKYGAPVSALLAKASKLDIAVLAPLHGPVWRKDIGWFIDKYIKWSALTPEDEGAVVIYGSLYGHTASAADAVAAAIRKESGKPVTVFDASETDTDRLVGEVWRVGTVVVLCPTYNGGIYPPIESLLADLAALNLHDRTILLGENGSWAPVTAKLMRTKLEGMKNITVPEQTLTIRGALHTADADAVNAFAKAAADAMA